MSARFRDPGIKVIGMNEPGPPPVAALPPAPVEEPAPKRPPWQPGPRDQALAAVAGDTAVARWNSTDRAREAAKKAKPKKPPEEAPPAPEAEPALEPRTDQKRADERIPELLRTPAAVRFLSVEPQLERVELDLDAWGGGRARTDGGRRWLWNRCADLTLAPRVDWVICGGESGPGARPFDLAWARSLRDQCAGAEVPFFFKQAGSNAVDSAAPSVDFPSHEWWVRYARSWLDEARGPWMLVDAKERICVDGADMARARNEGCFPVRALPRVRMTGKGGVLAELPPDLRIREFPAMEAT